MISANDRAYPEYWASTEWSTDSQSMVWGLLEAPELFLRDLQVQNYFHNIRHYLLFFWILFAYKYMMEFSRGSVICDIAID